jgi:pimeloyl-ACP methyl ester carboxylesterase
MPTAAINGIDINYECVGEGIPMLFIHGGYGGAATTLAPRPHEVRDILPTDSVKTIVYDRRNAFRSGYTDDHYDLETLAAEAAGLLDHLGIDRAIICGSSAGGPIALQFALSRPERVIALCLPNTGANLANPERAVGRSRREWVEQARSAGDVAAFESRKDALRKAPPLPANPRPDDAPRIEKLGVLLDGISDDELFHYATGELRNYEAYLDWDCSGRLGELKMPTCIIHGTNDNTVPYAWGHALHEGIPHSEFHAIEGADHGVLGYPAAAEVLREWVSRVTA